MASITHQTQWEMESRIDVETMSIIDISSILVTNSGRFDVDIEQFLTGKITIFNLQK
jgi:hypothetical protein